MIVQAGIGGGGGGGGLTFVTTDETLTGNGTQEDPLSVVNPTLYDVLSLSLTQSSTNAPTQAVLQNTIGVSYVLSYSGVGEYLLTFSSGILVTGKFGVFGQSYYEPLAGTGVSFFNGDTMSIVIRTYNEASYANGILNKTFLEIRIYP